jgi:hypothetical protein
VTSKLAAIVLAIALAACSSLPPRGPAKPPQPAEAAASSSGVTDDARAEPGPEKAPATTGQIPDAPQPPPSPTVEYVLRQALLGITWFALLILAYYPWHLR